MTQPNNLQHYARPEPTQEELKRIADFCPKLLNKRDHRYTLAVLMGLMRENVSLLREVNEHRAARGFEQLPTSDLPKI